MHWGSLGIKIHDLKDMDFALCTWIYPSSSLIELRILHGFLFGVFFTAVDLNLKAAVVKYVTTPVDCFECEFHKFRVIQGVCMS